jgi:hypothetical protein
MLRKAFGPGKSGGNSLMRNYMICPVDCKLFWHWVQRKWWDMHHVWGRWQMNTKFLLWNIQEGNSFQYVVMTGIVTFNCIWRKRYVVWPGSFGWVRAPALSLCEHDNELDGGEMRRILMISYPVLHNYIKHVTVFFHFNSVWELWSVTETTYLLVCLALFICVLWTACKNIFIDCMSVLWLVKVMNNV